MGKTTRRPRAPGVANRPRGRSGGTRWACACGADRLRSSRPGRPSRLPVGCFVIWVVFLNLAQERIRELVRARNQQPPAKYI
jgi:hypothetical protein